MQYQHTKREPEMAELIEGSERDRRRLAELLDGIRVGPGVDAMADGMREAVWADVRSRIRRRGIRMRIVRYAAAAAVMAGVVCGSWFMGGRRTVVQYSQCSETLADRVLQKVLPPLPHFIAFQPNGVDVGKIDVKVSVELYERIIQLGKCQGIA